MKNSTLTIILLIGSGFLLSAGVTQKMLRISIDATLEMFSWILVGLFQLLIMALYYLTHRQEADTLAASIEKIERLLTQINQIRETQSKLAPLSQTKPVKK